MKSGNLESGGKCRNFEGWICWAGVPSMQKQSLIETMQELLWLDWIKYILFNHEVPMYVQQAGTTVIILEVVRRETLKLISAAENLDLDDFFTWFSFFDFFILLSFIWLNLVSYSWERAIMWIMTSIYF